MRGICTNDDCPYLHVKVNPNAAVCQKFLNGYCPDGEKCKLKHTSVCLNFKKNGYCPDGDKCKLKHTGNKRTTSTSTNTTTATTTIIHNFDSISTNTLNSQQLIKAADNDVFVDNSDEDPMEIDESTLGSQKGPPSHIYTTTNTPSVITATMIQSNVNTISSSPLQQPMTPTTRKSYISIRPDFAKMEKISSFLK